MISRRTRLIGLTLAIAVFLTTHSRVLGQSSSRLQRQAESQAVEDYLKSLQLDALVIEHLEFETSRELDREARIQMASRLINEYAQRMMSGRNLSGSDWQAKAELLLQTYPELSTSSIRIAILQAKYVDGENVFREWWKKGRDESQKGDLAGRWYALKTELEKLNRQLSANYEDQVAMLQATPDNNDAQSRRLARIDGLLLHTDYLIGWSSYFLGVLTPENRRELMLNSDSHFRTFLQIEPKKTLTEVSPEWIDFSSDWNARALVGLAMSQRGLNHPEQSQYCFELIENHASSQQTRDLRYVWDLYSRVYLDQVSAAQEIVDSMGEARQISESGRTAFWLATLNSSIATRDRAPVISQRLLRSGLTGLARQFDAQRIKSFVSENQISVTGEDFLSGWIGGFLILFDAENSNVASKYDDAGKRLTAALAAADETTDSLDVARCQFLLAKIQLHHREYETAAKAFLECSKLLDNVAPELSAESQWLAVRALSENSRKHSRSQIQANRAIDQLTRRFPGSTFSKRAEFEKLRLNVSNLESEKAIDRLKRIQSNDSNYPLATHEIVNLKYQSWLDAHSANADSEARLFEALLNAVSEYQKLTNASDKSKLKTELLVVDAMLRTESIDIEAVRNRLEGMNRRAESSGANSPICQEYRYYQFLLANRTGDRTRALAESQWLSENAQGTPFEKSAMIKLAQLVDQQIKSRSNPTQDELAEAAIVFTKLVNLLGFSESELTQSANARVAYARLAALKLATGSTDEAIEILDSLNQIFPDHKLYLSQLASTYTQSKQYSKAISIWQKLARGVEPGSDMWIESKYNLAVCLYHTGHREDALQLHKQTCRLSPVLPDSWIKPFEELTALLNSD